MGKSEFRDKMLRSSGVSSKESYSEVGSKLLHLMGWKKGEGLGKNKSGVRECV